MKRFIQTVTVVVCLFSVNVVFAQQQPAVRIMIQTSADESAWQNYLSGQDKADIESGSLPIYKLAKQAFATAQNRGSLDLVPEDLRGQEIYGAIFILLNNLGNRDKISFDELRERAKGSGLYLPDMRMFLNETGAGLDEFKAGIINAIKKDESGVETVPASIIGVLAFQRTGATSYLLLVSEAFREQSNYIKGFGSYNQLPANIPLDDLVKLGQEEGLWVPVEPNFVLAFAKAFAERTAVWTRQETLLKNATEANAGVQALQAEIARLKTVNTADSRVLKQVISLENQLNQLVRQVEGVVSSQGNLTDNQKKVSQALILFEQTLVRINTEMRSVSALESKITAETDKKIETVYDDMNSIAETADHNDMVIVLSFSGVALLMLGLIFWSLRRSKKSTDENIVAVGDSLNNKIVKIEGQLAGVDFARDLVSKQHIGLLEINKSIVILVTVQKQVFKVVVTRINDSQIQIDGIRHHANDAKDNHQYGIGTNVSATIDRAGTNNNLTSLVQVKEVKKLA